MSRIINTTVALMFCAAALAAMQTQMPGAGPKPALPAPGDNSKTARFPVVTGWPDGKAPSAPQGFTVTKYAGDFVYPRWIYVLPNGDVLVSEARSPMRKNLGEDQQRARLAARFAGDSPNKITLLRDADGDGSPEVRETFLENLEQPFGMLLRGDTFYVANTNGVVSFPYKTGQTHIAGAGKKILDLPADGYNNHWVRNIVSNAEGTKFYVSVGSGTNVDVEKSDEKDPRRAAILEVNPNGSGMRVFASGLRNPNGLAWNPWSGELWTTVNERDMLGSDLVPDYLTNVPVGAHYGWPWFYWGENIDERVEHEMPNFLVEYTRTPEYALGPHVAPLGVVFTQAGSAMGPGFDHGAFVARHGSWNRKPAAGYDVVYVRFDERGNPLGKPVPVLKSFLKNDDETRGRPTWVAWDRTGALLVSDDTAGVIWRVSAPGATPVGEQVRNTGERLPPREGLVGDPRRAFDEN